MVKNNILINKIKKTKRSILKNIINHKGWTTNKKYVIFESDDWGTIRMPSKEIYKNLIKAGDKVDEDPCTRYDSLASEKDVELLFEVITHYKDNKGNYPIFTTNWAMANPDFEKIKATDYLQYCYEPFTKTLKNYPEHHKSFDLWKKGFEEKLIYPQFHCREHVNVIRWMKHLQLGKKDVLTAFNNRMISTANSFSQENRFAYMDTYNYDSNDELQNIYQVLRDGLNLFQSIFGFYSKSFIASCNVWDSNIEKELIHHRVEYIQGDRIQLVPNQSEGTKCLEKKRRQIGEINLYNQIDLLRNCEFEPSMNHNVDWIDNCLLEIAIAFNKNKPATICTHRLNYIGFIDEGNRDRNLKLFSELLQKILTIWPDVEFVTSVQLGEIIRGKK